MPNFPYRPSRGQPRVGRNYTKRYPSRATERKTFSAHRVRMPKVRLTTMEGEALRRRGRRFDFESPPDYPRALHIGRNTATESDCTARLIILFVR
jgi:hypothetical protein